MNAAIRSVVRNALARGFKVMGVEHGFTGLIAGRVRMLGPRDVGGVLHQGGTMLGTTRCEELRTQRGREMALQVLRAQAIDVLVIIGGNGSQAGAWELSKLGAAVIGIASTIDNDLPGTDISIGATTAVDVALEAIDRLRVTAAAMHRAFIVEVMGRDCGYLALMAGIAGGAEVIVVPERDATPEWVADELRAAHARGKSHAIAVVAEGAKVSADALQLHFRDRHPDLGFDLRVTRLGHVQRGGAPGVFDRMLGTMLGAAAVDAASQGRYGVLIGMCGGKPVGTPLPDVAGRIRPADTALLDLAAILAN